MTERLDLKGIVAFTVLAFLGAWAVTLPLWMSGQGLASRGAGILLLAMMMTPAVATVIVVFILSPVRNKRIELGLMLGGRNWWSYWLFAWIAIPTFCFAAPFIGALFGLYPLDVTAFSGFREMLVRSGQEQLLEKISIEGLVAIQFINGMMAPALNAIFVFGEELGWRGYLLPRLKPLGQWRALILSGVIWGLWHTPIILLGHNYPKHPQLGVLVMVGLCIVFGILFGWMRIATGSIWPAVIGHGALNGSAGAVLLFAKAGEEFDAIQAGITGWTGWLLPIAVIAILAIKGFIPAREYRPETATSEPPPPLPDEPQ